MTLCAGAEGHCDPIRLPLRPSFLPDQLKYHPVMKWANSPPADQTFSLVTPHESKFHSPGRGYMFSWEITQHV